MRKRASASRFRTQTADSGATLDSDRKLDIFVRLYMHKLCRPPDEAG
jgi:hypothetical protein